MRKTKDAGRDTFNFSFIKFAELIPLENESILITKENKTRQIFPDGREGGVQYSTPGQRSFEDNVVHPYMYLFLLLMSRSYVP